MVFTISALSLIFYFLTTLPDYSNLQDYKPNVMTRVHASNGHLIKEYSREYRIFIPIDEDGKIMKPPATNTVNSDKIYSIKIVDILFAVRSKNAFYRKDDNRSKNALTEDARAIGKNRRDKFLRDTILVSAHARNLGLQ